MNFDAVIFDMDGVLIDSEPIWQEVELEVFAQHGKRLTPEMKRTTMGWRLNEVVEHWLPLYEPEKQHQVANELIDGVIDRLKDRSLMPGVQEAIELFTTNEVPMAIASSSFYRLINAVTSNFGIANYFSVIHSAQDETKGKPDPAVYLSTARRLNVEPHRCVAIEDSENGVKAAQSAGMKVIAVPSIDDADKPLFDSVDLRLATLAELDERVFKL